MKKQLRRDALAIFKAAVAAANPAAMVESTLRGRRDLARYERIFVVGGGKAGGTMARAAERVLGRRITAGCMAVKDGDTAKSKRIDLRPSGHPMPDQRGVEAAKRIAELCEEAGELDLVICLLSGGASALLPAPAAPVNLAEKQETTKLLLACGATIHEINAVRKHISSLKGGQLAKLAAPARVLTLALSDVVGDQLDVIGSGPTAPDASTFASALAVLDRYSIRAKVPKSVRERLGQGKNETPKPGDPLFGKVENLIVGSNQQSLEAAAKKAKTLGYKTLILASTIEGETRDVARMHAAIARQIRTKSQPISAPACIISGGETTVTIRGVGKGGRNQEFALAAAIHIEGLSNTLILSAGTDGTDGPTDAAGAIADGDTCSRSRVSSKSDSKLDPKLNPGDALAKNDSYPFFESLGDLVITGSTGTNVMDVHLILVA
jgi:hydroxypyruvate reductase